MKRLPGEWEKQEAIIMVFPHKKSDWNNDLKSAEEVFLKIANSICNKQKLILVCDNKKRVKKLFEHHDRILFVEYETNDTWIRDFGPISVYNDKKREIIDFCFNGWGKKFESVKDNTLTSHLHKKKCFGLSQIQHQSMVLEGGSVESDGEGTLLVTQKCLLNPNRNPNLDQEEIESKLKSLFGTKRLLWLENGELLGDDTDAHIDTLARFVDDKTIVYVSCQNKNDPHYEELKKMHEELKKFKTLQNKPYKLIPLPLPDAKYKEGKRLPATYANFLITNHAVLLPTYKDPKDKEAIEIFKTLFPSREIIPINSLRLIEEGGSIHCSTMQIPVYPDNN